MEAPLFLALAAFLVWLLFGVVYVLNVILARRRRRSREARTAGTRHLGVVRMDGRKLKLNVKEGGR